MLGFLSNLDFIAPWALLGTLVIPFIWLILKVIPPAPIRHVFPAVVLLWGLKDKSHASDQTPWWLLLLRCMLFLALILGLAGPLLNKISENGGNSDLLILLDSSWAAGHGWKQTMEVFENELLSIDRRGGTVALVDLTKTDRLEFKPAMLFHDSAVSLQPKPYDPIWNGIRVALNTLEKKRFDTLWLSDGLEHQGEKKALMIELQKYGTISVYEPTNNLITISGVALLDQNLQVRLHRSEVESDQNVILTAEGIDLLGKSAVIKQIEDRFTDSQSNLIIEFTLPTELRNRLTSFSIKGQNHAGARFVIADQLKKPEAAIFAARDEVEMTELLKPSHYIKRAISDKVEFLNGTLLDVLPANPDVIFMADIVSIEASKDVLSWVKKGGTLVRFAGPRLANADPLKIADDPLLPVTIRQGGRRLDGAMSWSAPKKVAPFPANGPFFGLDVPDDLRVYAQILAEPGPDLSAKVVASLKDGTPLVTRKQVGSGQVILVHVTANAEWSNLSLSGLFPKLLNRLARSGSVEVNEAVIEGQFWTPTKVLNGFGELKTTESYSGVSGEILSEGRFDADMPPGIYRSGQQFMSRNLSKTEHDIKPMHWPSDVVMMKTLRKEWDLRGLFLSLAAVLMIADLFISLWLSGLLRSNALLIFLPFAVMMTSDAQAQSSQPFEDMVRLTEEVVLAYVVTGDKEVDDISAAGLKGLANVLNQRTSVESVNTSGVDLEDSNLSFFSLLYWPITKSQQIPSSSAYSSLNTYLGTGGVILFDTRNADILSLDDLTNNKMMQLTKPLDIPRLEPVPENHVLTRAFYLLENFPGRFNNGSLWVQTSNASVNDSGSEAFRFVNDGVTPVLIGSNDWSAAWAVDHSGRPKFAVGKGYAGERQREMALRFGVNLVMYVLTGNYKSDQVHVPAILERLGR